MAQSLKPELRERLLEAAAALFAEAGYQRATMAAIAERAGVSTGNVYRYFENKDALFYQVVSDEFVQRFLRLLKRRVGTLLAAPDLVRLDPSARDDGEALLRFWIEHRLQVIIVLDRAQGSAHEPFVERFVEALLKPSLTQLTTGERGAQQAALVRFLLGNVFRNTVRVIVSILESYRDEAEIRRAFEGFWSYQLAGLAGFSRWVNDV